jgi:dihydroorotate dehydrogenase electron transfer subunit
VSPVVATAVGVAHLRRAPVVAAQDVGDYRELTFAVEGMAALARAGQFVAATVGGPLSANLLRRAFSLVDADAAADQARIVVSPHAGGTRWLATRQVGDEVDLVGPLGRPFPLPAQSVPCVLVGGGYGSAPLLWLARVLRERGCAVHIVLGAATKDRLYGLAEAQSQGDTVVVTTDDGSLGIRGWVSEVLADVIGETDAAVVYGCGPMEMLRSVCGIAAEHGAVAQVAVEEAMACGVGVCMTCVLPVVGGDGVTRMARSCVEGPTFRGDRLRWDAIEGGRASVPADCHGAPEPAEPAGRA